MHLNKLAPEALMEALRRAARYWRWRAKTLPQPREQAVQDYLEARYHHHTAGELAEAVELTEWVVSQLETWGAWDWEERLCREVLEWLPARSQKAAVFLRQLGIVAQNRGDYDDALDWYRKSLAIAEALGDRAGMASSLSQMSVLLTETDRPAEAVPFNLESLGVRLELRVPIDINLHWLGRQREALGPEAFLAVLGEHLGEKDADAVVGLLDDRTGADAG